MAKSGKNADKNFKSTAYRMAAAHMNAHFDDDFTPEHVVNHMKSLRKRFQAMQFCRNLSGAGWDESTSTIIMDKDCFDRWSEDKNLSSSKLKEYINKPLVHYEDLAIIIGDDQAKGDYSKDFNTHFGGSAPIDIGDDDDSPLPDQHSPHIHNLDEEDSPTQAKETSIPKKAKPTTNLQNKKNGKGGTSKGKGNGRSDTDEFMHQVIYQVKEITSSINNVNMHWTEKLSKAVFAHKESYPIEMLERFYDTLLESEFDGRRFIGKSDFGQKDLLGKFMEKQV